MPGVLIDHVDRRKRIVSGFVSTKAGVTHRLGHMPAEGWFCTCKRGKKCAQIEHIKALVPPMGEPE